MKKVLVTGARGMLGVDLCRVFSEHYEVVPTDLEELDVRDFELAVSFVEKTAPDVIVHLAAMTDVDACEREPDLAYRANVVGTQNMVIAGKRCGAVFVYLSTGSIYGGDKEYPYTEYDEPSPRSVYSRTKYEGEKFVAANAGKYFIVTAGWMFGGGALDKKFVRKIMELSRTKDELRIVNDKFGSPTYTVDLSRGIVELLEWGRYGKYHLANKGYCSRYELAKKILSITGNRKCKLIPVSSEEFPLPAPRPRMEAISNYNLRLLGRDRMRTWEKALEEYVVRVLEEEKKLDGIRER